MATSRRAAGLGLLAYGIGTPLTMALIGSPGGDFSVADVTAYVSTGHRLTAFLLAYVGGFAALGLLPFAARFREEVGSAGRALWGLAVAGTATAVTGWFVVGGVAVAATEGGARVQGIARPVIYLLTEIGNLVAVCGPAFCVGAIAVLLAVRKAMPVPLRVLTALAGVCGIAAPVYFPMAVFWLWTIGFAIWAALSPAQPTMTSASTSAPSGSPATQTAVRAG
jgi:hypothetical protein